MLDSSDAPKPTLAESLASAMALAAAASQQANSLNKSKDSDSGSNEGKSKLPFSITSILSAAQQEQIRDMTKNHVAAELERPKSEADDIEGDDEEDNDIPLPRKAVKGETANRSSLRSSSRNATNPFGEDPSPSSGQESSPSI